MPPKEKRERGKGGNKSPRSKEKKTKSPKGKLSKAPTAAQLEIDPESMDRDKVDDSVESEGEVEDSVHGTENGSDTDSLGDLDLNDVNDAGQIVSLLKSVVKQLDKQNKDLKDVKNNQSTMLSDLNDIKTENVKLREELQKQSKELDDLKGKQNTLEGSIKTVKDTVKSYGDTLKEHNDKLTKLDSTVSDLVLDNMVNGDGTAGVEFAHTRTVVAYNIPYEDDENVLWKANSLIHNILELPGINVVRAKRKGLTEERLGILKIELQSTHAVELVLENKSKLTDHENSDINGIFIRQSQPDEVRRSIRNTGILLREFDVDGQFRMTARGDIVRRTRGNYRGQRGRGNRGRGNNRGGRGRRGQRVAGHTPDYDVWSRRSEDRQNVNQNSNTTTDNSNNSTNVKTQAQGGGEVNNNNMPINGNKSQEGPWHTVQRRNSKSGRGGRVQGDNSGGDGRGGDRK